jgi:hypothetical protein
VAVPRLLHFSEDENIGVFDPRPVKPPSTRAVGQAWLNGPLVWAVEEACQGTYLFPRDCPRIIVWPTPSTSETDRREWWGTRTCAMIAYVERDWLHALETQTLHRYEFPPADFQRTPDEWMRVCDRPVTPIEVKTITDLPGELRARNVELRVMRDLTPLRDLWSSTLHVSGIRLRNAQNW